MVKLAVLFLFAAGLAAPARADVSPTAPRLYLTENAAEFRGGTYSMVLLAVREERHRLTWATVQVTKKDPVHGTLTMEQSLKAGDSLGWTSRPIEEARRRISPKLLELLEGNFPIEFNPQAKVLSARRFPEWPVLSCHLVNAPEGSGCLEMVERRVRIPVNEIVIQEKSGKRITIRAPGPTDQIPSDERCSAHGGKIPARLLTEAEKNEAKATLQLSAADEGWKSKNPEVRRRAWYAYRQLLLDYSSEPAVQNNRERIKARSEAAIED